MCSGGRGDDDDDDDDGTFRTLADKKVRNCSVVKNNLSSASCVVYAIDARVQLAKRRARIVAAAFHSQQLFVSFNADLVFPRGLERSMADVIQYNRTMDRRHTERRREIAYVRLLVRGILNKTGRSKSCIFYISTRCFLRT